MKSVLSNNFLGIGVNLIKTSNHIIIKKPFATLSGFTVMLFMGGLVTFIHCKGE